MKNKKGKTELSKNGMRLYLANMSHELRTPMNAIMGLSDLLLKQSKNPEEKEYLLSMQTATKNLLMTVNNILDYESMVSGKISIEGAPFEVNALLQDIVSITKINLNDRRVRLIVNADPSIPSVLFGDSERIKQVLVHLLSNAEKFTKEGYIKLSVDYASVGEKARVLFAVEDTGIGMSQETVNRIFDAYEQADASFSRDEGGLGIGLNIAESLIDLLGGKLSVESEEGKGTKMSFELTLPVSNEIPASIVTSPETKRVAIYMKDAEEQKSLCKSLNRLGVPYYVLNNMGELFVEHDRQPFTHFFMDYEKYLQYKEVKEVRDLGITFVALVNYAKQIIKGSGDGYIRLPMWHKDISQILNRTADEDEVPTREILSAPAARILVVDDNDINLRVTEGLIRPFGIMVDTASSAEESIRLVTKTKYDLIFMDHMMPGTDGAEATRMIRGFDEPYYKSLPIIALSANAVEGAAELFKEAGMNDFLPKPVLAEDLEAMLWKWLPKEKTEKVAVEIKEEKTEDSLFGSFTHIDTQVGLAYTSGNIQMYKAIVRDFAASIKEKKQILNAFAQSEDIGRFTIEVHSVKSVAKTIGAIALSEKALELERLGHKRDVEAIREKMSSLNREFDFVTEDLKPFARAEELHIDRTPIEADKLKEKLRKIYYAADDFDYDGAKSEINDIGVYEYPKNLESLYMRMNDTIEDIDYKGTKDLAIEMMAMIGSKG